MLTQIQVFDKDIFKPGTPIKVHFPGGSFNDFFAIVNLCELDALHLVTILPPESKAVSYTKDRIAWWHPDEDIKKPVIKIERVLDKSVEILRLEQAFNIQGVELR